MPVLFPNPGNNRYLPQKNPPLFLKIPTFDPTGFVPIISAGYWPGDAQLLVPQ